MKKIFFIINIALLFASCSNKEQSETITQEDVTLDNIVTLTDEQYKVAQIDTGKLSYQNISTVVKLTGKIDVPPQSLVSISAPMGGYLKSTKLLNGMHIRKGEILAVMEDAQYIQLQEDYLSAKAQLSLLESEYNRQKELNQSKASSDKVFEQAKASYQTQLITIKSLEEKLKIIGIQPQKLTVDNISKSITINSPINGFVAAVNTNLGKYVQPNDVLFELIDPTDIHLSLTVFDKDINKLSIGQKLIAYSNSNPDKKYTSKIILISKFLTEDNSAIVHCHFDRYDPSLVPGMFMNAEIELSANYVTALPADAIVRYENKQYVFLVQGHNQFLMQEVNIGKTENGYTEIIASKDWAEKNFVTQGAYTLLMSLKNTNE